MISVIRPTLHGARPRNLNFKHLKKQAGDALGAPPPTVTQKRLIYGIRGSETENC